MVRELRRLLFLTPVLIVLAVALVHPAGPAYTPDRLGILIVGAEKDGAMKARETALIDAVIRLKKEAGPTAQKVKIYSYHFEKDAEKRYCEETLKIRQADLLFLGLVTLSKEGIPGKLIYKDYRVTDPEASAGKLVATVAKHLGLPAAKATTSPRASETPKQTPEKTPVMTPSHPTASPTVKATPSPASSPAVKATPSPASSPTVKSTPSPAATTSAAGERWSLQMGYYTVRENAEAFTARFPDEKLRIVEGKAKDGARSFRVLYGDFATREEAMEAMKGLLDRADVLTKQAEEWKKLYEEWKDGKRAPFAAPAGP